jgi:tetratricopeptide (TPR) repeat protein
MNSSVSVRLASRLLLSALLWPGAAVAQSAADTLAPLDHAMALAEASLRAGEFQIAESRYRAAAFDAWMIAGALHVAAGRLPEAREAFRHATHAVAEADAAFRSLALVHLQLGEPSEAVAILSRMSVRTPDDRQARHLLAQALAANGQPHEAVQTLEETHAADPDDAETAFLLASGYLRAGRIEAADRLFAEVAAARPIPQTWVLIGRAYRDFLQFDRARTAFDRALAQDPATRRAHYYLGTMALMTDGEVQLEAAIREFRAELALVPTDPAANLRLGMALLDARREEEALEALETAVRLAPSDVAWHHLGRCQLALGRPAEAVVSLRRALAMAEAGGNDASRIRRVHYQLAVALRETGAAAEAAPHFEAAREASSQTADAERERLARYLDDGSEPPIAEGARLGLESPLAAASPAVRDAVARGVTTALARAYLNLGVMRAQAQQFDRAAEFLEQAAAADPDFPQVQFALGTARFNAGHYAPAAAALATALAADPGNADVRRMLALAHFSAGGYRAAADLLADDPRRGVDPSLEYTYGLALVRSDRAADAESVFTRLLAMHGDRAELHVILGQAHAQQGNFEAAEQALQRARQLEPNVPDANATLGLIYLRQGKLAAAAAALREELRGNPANLQARHMLATALELEGTPAEALTLLRGVLREQPDFSDARYLLGKILLGEGDAEGAVPHLEAAVRLAPDNASYHYQLAQGYRRLGQLDLADEHVARFQALKEKARRRAP